MKGKSICPHCKKEGIATISTIHPLPPKIGRLCIKSRLKMFERWLEKLIYLKKQVMKLRKTKKLDKKNYDTLMEMCSLRYMIYDYKREIEEMKKKLENENKRMGTDN